MDLLIIFILVGFIAQIIDGALGMAYGVTSTSFLLSLGVSPAVASASVHTAEIFTTGTSGMSHFKLGNVDRTLFKRLLVPGILGGVLGAYILTSIPGSVIKPFIAIYLMIMGVRILLKTRQPTISIKKIQPIPLAGVGGFCDAIGGGGWGPIVTSTLVANGHNPRISIGTVNTTEFFVTASEAVTFVLLMRSVQLEIILGLMIGGVIAAPMAAVICKRLSSRVLMLSVGVLIIFLSIRTLVQVF